MPDDDRHTRDRIRTLDPLCHQIKERVALGREDGIPPEQLVIPENDVTPKAEKTLGNAVRNLGKPDLNEASERVRKLATGIRDQDPEALDLCAGHRTSGMNALLDRAISVVLASDAPEALLDATPEDLAERVGMEFARGAIRRYSIDRIAPFGDESILGIEDSLDFLELADLTFTTAILRGLVRNFLR